MDEIKEILYDLTKNGYAVQRQDIDRKMFGRILAIKHRKMYDIRYVMARRPFTEKRKLEWMYVEIDEKGKELTAPDFMIDFKY